jgi:AAA+ superfamily predicted ATPase
MVNNQQIIDALYNQSDGLIGRTVNLIKKAAVKAIKSGREKITIEDIEYLPTL